MRYLLLDWFNIIKRYTYSRPIESLGEGELKNDLTITLLNKLSSVMFDLKPDMIYICSDHGFNERANSIVKNYKGNRKRFKSLNAEEKEKSYIEYLKTVMLCLPFPFLEVKNTEADMIINILKKFIIQRDNKAEIVIASSDSDFIQLLDDHTSIYDWNKGEITEDNWNKKYRLDYFLNSANYSLAKAIVGDKSDNINGIKGIGWKKVNILFYIISKYFEKDIVIKNTYELKEIINKLLDNDEIENNDKKLLEKFSQIMKNSNNEKIINNNYKVIDLGHLATPYVYNIIETIKRKSFKDKIFFNRKKFLDTFICLKMNPKKDEEYEQILRKNSKSMALFKLFEHKIFNTMETLKNR